MLTTILLALAVAAPAAVPANACPTINVSTTADGGGSSTFWVEMSGGDPDVTPTFNWTVSEGKIETGQGTSSVTLSAPVGHSVTATLDVGGYARTCVASASQTVKIE